ncbi:hypothetical protein [Streptomyces spectabilis]|uniref:Uncharacterized protein n=1 Tax=Streptomyces spectabilis TaxID=68270 RepID=A0A7W8EXV5_STRST|nr:hypothetical protein [Streptomyces spectabilis]MBB5109467.1 hypothetical protein [Streptomyces spectabilis]MCI3907814.1 hypothetical protein [Streptomyces spectabilis]GGV53432.1 hypothetical protein GCM10010245_84330 [Streptomyces spectabilis]
MTSASEALTEAIGHYMNAAAAALLNEGVPVIGVRGSGRVRTLTDDDFETDVDGAVSFTTRFERDLYPDSENVDLHWSGTSGWCLLPLKDDDVDYYGHARWIGAGLVPPVDRVVSFVATARLSPAEAGSSERPFYRTPGSDLTELHQRLAAFVPAPGDLRGRTYGMCFNDLVNRFYTARVHSALNSSDDAEISVALRPGELDALRHLLEYAQTHAVGLLGAYAHHLTEDLDSHRQFAAAPSHRAMEAARSVRQQLRDRQRGE